jgi:hypothetical protein
VAVKGGREWSRKARTENLPGGGFRRRLFQYPYFTAQLLQHSPYDRSENRSLGLASATVAQRTVLALTPPPGSATSVPTVRAGPG